MHTIMRNIHHGEPYSSTAHRGEESHAEGRKGRTQHEAPLMFINTGDKVAELLLNPLARWAIHLALAAQ